MQIPLNGWLFLTSLSAAGVFLIIAAMTVRRAQHQQKEANAALHEAEQKLQAFLDTAPVAIFETTVDGVILMANKTMATMLGYETPEDMLFNRNQLRKPLYVDPAVREKLVQVLTEKIVCHDFDCHGYKKDGRTIWVTGNGRAVHDADG